MLTVCFRYDDASATSDHSVESAVFDIFRRYQFPLCVAAIPFRRKKNGELHAISPGNTTHLVDAVSAGIVEIAQHGHSHLPRSTDTRGRRSEFAGLGVEEQVKLISEGMQRLQDTFGQRIKGFVPPWNTYDCATVQALETTGFMYLSVGMEVRKCSALPILPITSTLSAARIDAERARSFPSLAPVVVVIIHSDDFEEYRSKPRPDEELPTTNLRELESLLAWLKAQRRVKVEALARVAETARKAAGLRTASELKLPYRLRVRIPPMIVRAPGWRTVPAILYRVLRNGRSQGTRS